jgi:hypothetical protein
MSLDEIEFNRYFKTEDKFVSGGGQAILKITEIDEERVRYRSIKNKQPQSFKYWYLDIVIAGFDKINPAKIQSTIQQVFLDAGLHKNYSTENYAYGFAREYLNRSSQKEFVASGEVIAEKSHIEGRFTTVLVDRYERNARARAECIAHFGAICQVCAADLGKI